jgi:hypothetical protein
MSQIFPSFPTRSPLWFQRPVQLGRGAAIILAASTLALLGVCPQVQAQTWVKVLTAKDKDVWFVNAESVSGQGQYRLFWAYGISHTIETIQGHPIKSRQVYLSADCKSKALRPRYIEFFDVNEKKRGQLDLGESVPLSKVTQANEAGAAMLKFVCAR